MTRTHGSLRGHMQTHTTPPVRRKSTPDPAAVDFCEALYKAAHAHGTPRGFDRGAQMLRDMAQSMPLGCYDRSHILRQSYWLHGMAEGYRIALHDMSMHTYTLDRR